jgi:hypothetical protein
MNSVDDLKHRSGEASTAAGRTRAVIDGRKFLETLVGSEEPLMWDLVRTAALMLLRHFPTDRDIVASSVALPTLWATPLPNNEPDMAEHRAGVTASMSLTMLIERGGEGATLNSSNRLLRAQELLRDCRVEGLSPSTRVTAAFDAIYLCCILVTTYVTKLERDEVHPNSDIVIAALDFLVSARAGDFPLPAESVDLVLRLMLWSSVGVEANMPCAPEDAVDLAEQFVGRTRSLLSKDENGAARG